MVVSHVHRNSKYSSKFCCPVDRNPCMNLSLSSKEGSWREFLINIYLIVPCSWVKVDPFPCRDQKCSHVFRSNIISISVLTQTDNKGHITLYNGSASTWPKQLTSIWVVVTHPQINLFSGTGLFYNAI